MGMIGAAELSLAAALAVVLLGLKGMQDESKSTRLIKACGLIEIIWAICDVVARFSTINVLPIVLVYVSNVAAYTLGAVSLLIYIYYCRAYIEERAEINRWNFILPTSLSVATIVLYFVKIIGGKLFKVHEGLAIATGGVPVVALLCMMAVMLYLPALALSYRKRIGIQSVCLLGLFGIFPIVLSLKIIIFGGEDLTIIGGLFSLLIICVLLQGNVFYEKENEHTKELIIKQSRMEELATEQEAQLEEIMALNTELEDRQEKLREAAVAQKQHLNQIDDLNQSLNNQLAIINSMSKVYFSCFYVDIETGGFIEVNSIETVRGLIGIAGDAQKSLFAVADTMALEGTGPALREFVDLSTVNERLKDRDVVTCEYYGKTTRWSRMYFIAGERYEDGKLKSILVTTRTIHDEKKQEEKQLTEIKKAKDEAERANAAKTSFLFNMSHDIRTPMNAIIGFRELLEKNQENPEKRQDYLRKIEEASNVLLSIINNVLEMARIEKGTIEINEVAWSTEQFIDSMYSVFADLMEQKNISFVKECAVNHNYVFCDPIKLREVFLNIVSNAYKYTNPGGKVTLRLEEEPNEREGWTTFKTTVSDNGIGMSEDFLPHIFEEFSRESNTTENKIEGTGLGMPIVKRLIELMGGTISVSSKKGEGSTFVVCVPHRIASKDDLQDTKKVEFNPDSFKGKRILVAEDNDLNAEIALELLNESGFYVERVANGQECLEAVEKADAGYYNLILMDVQMPIMNGYEATRKIRELKDLDKSVVPIISMTANAFEEDKKEAFKAGMNGHLAKPVNAYELMREIAIVLSDE